MIDALKPYPAYKDSGVPWLGQVPEHWEVRRTKTVLRERNVRGFPNEPLLAATQTKGVIRKEQYENRTVLALKDLHLLKLVEIGDFVISLRSFQGGIEYARVRGIISPAYTILYPQENDNHAYLAFLFKSRPYIENLQLFVTGIRQGQNIDYEKLSRSPIPIPPLPEQTAIVRFLDFVDRRIRRLIHFRQRQIKLLEEYRQAIIHQAVTGQIDVRTGRPYPAYKDSGVPWLGQVPEHWEVAQVKDVFECLNHRRVPLSSTERGAMKNRLYDYYGASGVIDKVDDYLFDDELLLIAEDGANLVLRNLPLAIVARGRFWVNNHAHVLKPRSGNIEFLASLMETIDYKPWISGAAQPKLTKDRLLSIAIATPPRQEQTEIINAIHASTVPCSNLIQYARREIALLREYRERLIADVVTGKVDVREVAARLPEELPEEENDGPEPSDEAETFASDGEDEEAIDFDEVVT
jgi:type I restriction enzyme S subunit